MSCFVNGGNIENQVSARFTMMIYLPARPSSWQVLNSISQATQHPYCVRFQFLTDFIVKIAEVCDVKPCSLVKVY